MCRTTTGQEDQHASTHLRRPSEQGPVANQEETVVYDVILIGAGIAGIINVGEAVQQKYKKILCLDKKHRLGGLWIDLPAWQTVQNDPRDFCIQGFTTNKKVWAAGDVVHFLEEYVRVQGLRKYFRLGTELIGQEWSKEEGCWILKTVETKLNAAPDPSWPGNTQTIVHTYRCKKLILCTGKHATPIMPKIATDGSVPMVHSSQVWDWKKYEGKSTAVVGAGASALDLCINALKMNETAGPEVKTHWILRTPKHFGGVDYCDLISFTILQLVFGPWITPIISYVIDLMIRVRFWWAGRLDWVPSRRFDLVREQFIPNRSYLMREGHKLDRHAGTEVVQIRNKCLYLANGEKIEGVDALLMGTGYNSPKHNPGLNLRATPLLCSSVCQGDNLGRLFLFGELLLDSTGSTPISTHVMARHFWHTVTETGGALSFEGLAKVSDRVLIPAGTFVNHLDMISMAAFTTPGTYAPFIWRVRMLSVHLYYRFMYNTRVFYADRVLGHNLSLDEPSDAALEKSIHLLTCPVLNDHAAAVDSDRKMPVTMMISREELSTPNSAVGGR